MAQHPLRHPAEAIEIRYAASQPVVSYVLRVDSADLSGYDVTVRIRNAPDTFRLAMVTHPEYDSRFWRYLENMRIEAPGAGASVNRADSALWRVTAPGGSSTIRYRLHLPAQQTPFRSSWVPFLAPTGGLIGGPHSFMYIVGATLAPAHVTLDLPTGWQIATGLEATADPHTFFAPSVGVLVDCPILVGRLRDWRFTVDGVPHRVVYWPRPDAQSFDSVALVAGLQQLVRQALALFGRLPYRDYTFLVQDGALGSLEHANSVTLGAPSDRLARDLTGLFAETAHEFFHTWNLVRIRPVGYDVDVDYRPPPRSRGLWWSEGVTMLYADLFTRRAGLPRFDTTRVAHLEGQIANYLASSGDARFSPESVSLVTYGVPPGALGDYSASVHLQGELIGTMLDLIVRDATAGRRSLDDVMRAMLERFSGDRGFETADVERVVARVCGCPVHDFFTRYVKSAHRIDFDRYLAVIGLRTEVAWRSTFGRDSAAVPDLRIFAWLPPGRRSLSLIVTDPAGVWGKAGLHTGDPLAAINGVSPSTTAELRTLVSHLRVGDTVRVVVTRPTGRFRATLILSQLVEPNVRILEIPGATARQREMRDRWASGSP